MISFSESRATVTKKMRRVARLLDKIEKPSINDSFWSVLDEWDDLENWVQQLEIEYRKVRQPSPAVERPAHCHAGSDGDCNWKDCPQEANNRANYQKVCPLLREEDED